VRHSLLAQQSEAVIQTYPIRGVVEELTEDGRTVVIRHEAVPNFMPAMTMPFKVRDEKELENLSPGDEVTFRLLVSDQDNWIDEVRATGKTVRLEARSDGLRIATPLKVGDAVPDYSLTNEFGESLSLGQFKGKVLAGTFIFTRCPLPDFCRRMSNNFGEASERLKAMKSPPNWHLLSISFDPEFDTPETLKQYGQRYSYDPQVWSFATAASNDIEVIAGRFGLIVRRNGTELDHNLRTVVIDAEGKVRKIFLGNEWTPAALVREMVKAAHPRVQQTRRSR